MFFVIINPLNFDSLAVLGTLFEGLIWKSVTHPVLSESVTSTNLPSVRKLLSLLTSSTLLGRGAVILDILLTEKPSPICLLSRVKSHLTIYLFKIE